MVLLIFAIVSHSEDLFYSGRCAILLRSDCVMPNSILLYLVVLDEWGEDPHLLISELLVRPGGEDVRSAFDYT